MRIQVDMACLGTATVGRLVKLGERTFATAGALLPVPRAKQFVLKEQADDLLVGNSEQFRDHPFPLDAIHAQTNIFHAWVLEKD